jgi:hypothetical protein
MTRSREDIRPSAAPGKSEIMVPTTDTRTTSEIKVAMAMPTIVLGEVERLLTGIRLQNAANDRQRHHPQAPGDGSRLGACSNFRGFCRTGRLTAGDYRSGFGPSPRDAVWLFGRRQARPELNFLPGVENQSGDGSHCSERA